MSIEAPGARIVQLSDLHLLSDPEGCLAGVPTRRTFRQVLDHVDAFAPDADRVVLTGDLAQDESLETYRALREMLGARARRCRLIPGNHDDPDALRRVFADVMDAELEHAGFSEPLAGWRLIGLDTHVPGEVVGRLGTAQVAWLRAELAAHAGQPTVVFLHHPPVPIGVGWMDAIGLCGPQPLLESIQRAPQVRLVCAGHVHREFEGRIGDAVVVTTPSTAMQFSGEEEEKYEMIPPGYRVIDLAGEGCDTRVVRLAELSHPPGEPG